MAVNAASANLGDLREAIVAPRPSDAEPEPDAPPPPPRPPSWWALSLAALGGRGATEDLLSLPLARRASGFGGFAGLVLGAALAWPFGLWRFAAAGAGAIAGSMLAVVALALFACAVNAIGVARALAAALTLAAIAVWAFVPWPTSILKGVLP